MESLAWRLLLPAVAECTASVWFPQVTLYGKDLQMAALNLMGAFIQGFFVQVEKSEALFVSAGAAFALLPAITLDVQGYFLSTLTSWAGMVGKASFFAHGAGSYGVGVLYIVACVLLGVVAHMMGAAIASGLAALVSGGKAKKAPSSDGAARAVRFAVLASLAAFVVGTYITVLRDLRTFEDSDAIRDGEAPLLAFFDEDHRQLIVAIGCSIAGAWTGNIVGSFVDRVSGDSGVAIPRGTLACNALFGALGLSLNAATLRHKRWGRSVLIQSFAGSFCGAASAFNGHATDASELLSRKEAGGWYGAARNSVANVALALLVFLAGYELEWLLERVPSIDLDKSGFVSPGELAKVYGVRMVL